MCVSPLKLVDNKRQARRRDGKEEAKEACLECVAVRACDHCVQKVRLLPPLTRPAIQSDWHNCYCLRNCKKWLKWQNFQARYSSEPDQQIVNGIVSLMAITASPMTIYQSSRNGSATFSAACLCLLRWQAKQIPMKKR